MVALDYFRRLGHDNHRRPSKLYPWEEQKSKSSWGAQIVDYEKIATVAVQGMKVPYASAQPRPAWGMRPVGVFLFFGAAMAGLAGTTLLWRGTTLDRVWALNPRAYRELAPLGSMVGVPFLLLSAALFAAGVGWFRRHLWGWWLAVVLITTQVVGNFVTLFLGRIAEGVTGLVIAGALLAYLLRPRVKTAFRNRPVGRAGE